MVKTMNKMLKLAIVGRPNVGKSALFNRICKKKIAIVDEAEGITRDRLYSKADIFGYPFEVIDTGGIDSRSKAPFNELVKRQAEIAIEEADTIIMVVDSKIGITELDKDLARILLKTKKPLCLAVNKIDDTSRENLIHQFYSLGISKVVGVSAAQNWHIAELLETAFENRKDNENIDTGPDTIKIALVGRPNVGKSSLINYLLNEERCIVSPIPGTTRDSIDASFTHDDTLYTLIDTAGIRRKHAEHEVVDKFAAIRTERTIERTDICLFMLDAQTGITTQEKKIANAIEAEGKGCILLFNKWDLVKGFRMEHCLQGIEDEVPFLKHCPKIFISAKTGRNVDKIFDVVKQVHADSLQRITTHQLNKFVGDAMQKIHPPMIQGKRLRIYYMAQVAVQPPKFVFFVNIPTLMTEAYKKYLYNQFREKYGFLGVPILFYLKGKKKPQTDQVKTVKDREGLLIEGYESEEAESIEIEDETFEPTDFDFEEEMNDGDLDDSYFTK
jgi:GTP-binding protein